MKHLNEFLNMPTDLEPTVKIGDFTLYSSESLKKDFMLALSKNSVSKNSSELYNGLVLKDMITPCWTQKNFKTNLLFKIFANEIILGLYVPTLNRIFIVMNSNINMFGFTDETALASVTVHEAMHMAAANSRVNFLKVWKKELDEYYFNFFKLYFKVPSDKYTILQQKATGFYTDVYNTFEHMKKRGSSNGDVSNKLWLKIFDKYFSNPKQISTQESSEDLKDFARMFLTRFNTLMAYYSEYKNVFIPLFLAYKFIGAPSIPRTTVCQELFYPSEVIAIMSQFPNFQSTKINQTLKLIKN